MFRNIWKVIGNKRKYEREFLGNIQISMIYMQKYLFIEFSVQSRFFFDHFNFLANNK